MNRWYRHIDLLLRSALCSVLLVALMVATSGLHVVFHTCGVSGLVRSSVSMSASEPHCDGCCDDDHEDSEPAGLSSACCHTTTFYGQTDDFSSRLDVPSLLSSSALLVRTAPLPRPQSILHYFKRAALFAPLQSHSNSRLALLCIFLC